MSVARGFGLNGKSYYTNVCGPRVVHCNFIVDSTNGNGLGIRSLKSNGYIESVFMNTSASLTGTVTNTSFNITAISGGTSSLQVGMPVQGTAIPVGTTITAILSSSSVQMSAAATGTHAGETITYQGVNSLGQGSPNPAAGFAVVKFKQNFNYYLGGFSGFVSPIVSPTTAVTSGLTSGQAYVITTLGTTTLAEWQTIGLPYGLTPTVGQTIIVPSGVTGTGGSHTGKVGLPGVSGVSSLEIVGDPNTVISNASIAANGGAYVVVQFLAPTVAVTSGTAGNAVTLNSGTTLEATGGGTVPTVQAPKAPADGSVVGMAFYFDGSSVTVDGL